MSMLTEIMSQVVASLKIVSEENIEVMEQMGTGLSGAEVYKVHLRSDSTYQGYFFLKIDTDDKEFKSIDETFPFRKAICVEKANIYDVYYVFLYQPAGGSSHEFISFRKFDDAEKRDEITRTTLLKHLQCTHDTSKMIREDISPSKILKRMLGNKLDCEKMLFKYLEEHFNGHPCQFKSFSICNTILPNPFAYAVDSSLWGNIVINDSVCPIHGDMHGENLFISKSDDTAYLIDIALASHEGYPFFDTAYFELSELLRFLATDSIHSWIQDVAILSKGDGKNLDCRAASFVKEITKTEVKWIDETYNASFSYKDSLNVARNFARVIAGLNYAGKGNISDDMRMKALIYAASFLQNTLERHNIDTWLSCEPALWQDGISDAAMRENTCELAEFAGHFLCNIRYFLICGPDKTYGETICDPLSRIPWSGIISFQVDPDNNALRKMLSQKKMLKDLLLGEESNWENIRNSGSWWLYATGYKARPETLVDTFPKWISRYLRFMDDILEAVGAAVGPSEAVIMLDVDSFQREQRYYERLLELCNKHKIAKIAILSQYKKTNMIKKKDFPDLEIQEFNVSLENLARYCQENLNNSISPKVLLPSVSEKYGIFLDDDDRKFIEEDATLICDALLYNENIDTSCKANFYYGEQICWTAIKEKLYVPRKEIENYCEMIKKKISESNQSIFNLAYEPGSGATVICKAICWELRNTYPTLEIKKITDNTSEALRRLSSKSGKPLLLLADADFSASHVDALFSKLRSQRLKALILYPYRTYNELRGDQESGSLVRVISRPVDDTKQTLGPLGSSDAQNFQNWYTAKLYEKGYEALETQRRKDNLGRLTFETTMFRFRTPFFYGMYTFEKDFISIENYVENIIARIQDDSKTVKAVKYIALLTYYLTSTGMKYTFARCVLGMQNGKKITATRILQYFSEKCGTLIFLYNSEYRICHALIAKIILDKLLHKSNLALKKLCEDLTSEFKEFEGREIPSDALNELAMDMFIKREQEKDSAKFAQVILDIKDPMLQEGLFKHLTQVFPKNAHFFQHYGRLIVHNRPYDIDIARPHFDQAISLEKDNPLHYHARGTMYLKKIKDKFSTHLNCAEILNSCQVLVEIALDDFYQAIELVRANYLSGISIDMFLYPYSSILDLTTFIPRQMQKAVGAQDFKTSFLASGLPEAKWCRELIAIANQHDVDIRNIYEDLKDNIYYTSSKSKLSQLNFTPNELRDKIKLFPHDTTLKYAYVNTADFSDQRTTPEEAKYIARCCETILEKDHKHEGILWKWFIANINSNVLSWDNTVGLLQSISELEKNQIANYILYVLYFCKFIETKHQPHAIDSLRHMSVCRSLSKNNSMSTTPRLYYTNSKSMPMAQEYDEKFTFDGTICDEIKSTQTGYLSLDIEPKFRAFFVPARTDLKKGQAFNQPVICTIGFSYDGLRASNVVKRNN